MNNKDITEDKKETTKKGFFSKLLEKLDKKIEEKAKKAPCCDKSGKNKGSGCC